MISPVSLISPCRSLTKKFLCRVTVNDVVVFFPDISSMEALLGQPGGAVNVRETLHQDNKAADQPRSKSGEKKECRKYFMNFLTK